MSEAAQIARKALSRGDLIGAYDATVAAMEAGDDSGAIRHQQILALARMGDTDRAMEKFAEYGLEGSSNVDERTIGARIWKDRAFNTPAGPARQAAMERAFEAYHDVYRATHDSFPGINAATLALLAGREADSRALAEALLAAPDVAAPADYWKAATRAEALLLLGRTEEVTEVLTSEAVRGSADLGGRSSTLRQLGMIGAHLGMNQHQRAALVAPLRPPRVLHYCGHMFGEDAADEARIRATVDAVLDEEEVGFAYGALACGADLVIAEALLDRGVELNVVMPFDEQDFLEQSVQPGGPGWEERYRDCLRRAKRVLHASPMAYFGNPDQYGYASRMAMGLTCLRAEHLAAEAIQLAIWDGIAPEGPAGTGADVLAWQEAGGRTRTVDPGQVSRGLARPDPRIVTTAERALAAILFTDFAGFSKLNETVLPAFWDGVMRIIGDILDAHGEVVVARNTWGDALYGVIDSAPAAAEISLQLQDALDEFDYSALGLEGKGGRMRIGAHYGPAYRAIDHITGRLNFYGNEVSKAARIEPVTPTGAVFVTEPFAAILALEAPDRFDCRYVGRIQLAKGYGSYPMYRLTRAD
ncbi:MAG TPA: tetratricopeptide repeat-containing protein [Allosphingosinicella sp.]|nr:tetratricopeptide repeat-containing protein [Allosphingosinicella sp.]